ncbi:MAG: phosphopyruvate hydratase, partial [Candidatus Woesearchaeota archaeon]
MARIQKILAREVLDSRGNPTVEVEAFTKKNSAKAIVPSGASTGAREAVELRDHDSRYKGLGVQNAIHHVREVLAPKIVGRDCTKQEEIDNLMKELDGTINKSKIGANAILAVSMATCRLAAKETGKPLYQYIAGLTKQTEYIMPVPFMNVINGGAHAGNSLEMQEFMIAPIGAKNFTEAARMCSETYHTLKEILKNLYGKQAVNVGDEGGFAPPIKRAEDCLKILRGAINESGYEGQIKIGIDAAATQFCKEGKYHIDGRELDDDQLVEYYEQLCQDYPIISIEDPFNEEAFEGFAKLTKAVGKNV